MKSDPKEIRKIRQILKENTDRTQVFRITEYRLGSSTDPSHLVCNPKLVEYGRGEFKIVAQTGDGEKEFFLGGPPQKGGYKYSALTVDPVGILALLIIIADYKKTMIEVARKNNEIAFDIHKYLERKDS